ncbi:MAG: hypothetical protein IKP45_02890 [Bacteroidales bacterium]|nr:hypothetical protein [Bacteroidales bacterium]
MIVEVPFLIPVFQSLLASVIYGTGKVVVDFLSKRKLIEKRFNKAFENAVCRFYADPEHAGNEARKQYDEYMNMLQDASKKQDIFDSNCHIYEKMFDLFVQEVSKDKILSAYVILNGVFTTQKKLDEISKQIQEAINTERKNREEEKQEHQELSEQIEELKNIISNPSIKNLSLAPINGSAVGKDDSDSHIIQREQLVERCISSIENGKILIIHGSLKVGKTTLAQLIAKKKEGIEINDNVLTRDLETEVMKLLAENQGGRYIITTQSVLNEYFSTLDFSKIDQVEVPLLNKEETKELIKTYSPTHDLSFFIYCHTNGHPLLVKTLCSYLSSCGWSINEDNFYQILSYSFDRNLPRALSDLMGILIPETETRNLLNRLMLVNGPFVEKEVIQLAGITPSIGEPRRRFYSLVPTWVTDADGHFKVSPLLIKGWRTDIQNDCLKQCNKLLAQNLISSGHSMNESDVLNFINYSVRANEFDDAGYMYVTVLNKLHDINAELPQNSLLKSIWIDLPLPVQMSLNLRIEFRLTQLMLLSGLSKDQRQYLLWDLKRLLQNYEEEHKAFFYSAVALLCWQEDDVAEGLKYYNLYNTLEKQKNSSVMSQLGEMISLIDNNIWIFLLRLTTVEEFESWLESFSRLHIEYSHDDKEICNCCYLSVSHLVSHHLQEVDFETKLENLRHICNKAEQSSCPEVAIVSLFKMLELYSTSNRYDDAKMLFDGQYHRYKEHPMAEILFNGAMALACYRSKRTGNDNLHYFKQAMDCTNKEIVPDVQLHVKELFAHVVAENNPQQSIILLNEALEYANDENHRIDLFEYYQCKGELSYAYWCIDDKAKAVELLSDCVKFVLPLAENEKDFSKTYLCLCNCLINKYLSNLQGKLLPEEQAEPYRGMFTESNLTWLNDLYTVDRLYVSCYQMSDLCSILKMQSLEKEWAHMTVNICKNRGDVSETHYLIFLLLPLFLKDDDLENSEFIINHSVKAKKLTHQKHPELLKKNADLEFVEFQIIPLLMEALTLMLRGNDTGLELVRKIMKNYSPEIDSEPIRLVQSVFERESYDRSYIDEINKLDINENYSVYLCAYLMTAFHSNVDYAFSLLINTLPKLQEQLEQIMGSRVNALISLFVSTFWKIRILRNPNEFVNYAHLKDRGLRLIDEYEGKTNQANHTMFIISQHLKSTPKMNQEQENWLDA